MLKLRVFSMRFSSSLLRVPVFQFSAMNRLSHLLTSHPEQNYDKIKAFVESLATNESVNVKKKYIREYLDKYGAEIDPALRQRFIKLLILKLGSPDEFCRNLPYYASYDPQFVDRAFFAELKINFFRYLNQLDRETVLEFLKTFSNIAQTFTNSEMQKIVLEHFQGFNHEDLLREFLKINLITNNFLFNILAENAAEDLFRDFDKQKLYEVFLTNGIIFNNELQHYFAHEIAASALKEKELFFGISAAESMTPNIVRQIFAQASLEDLFRFQLAHMENPEVAKIYTMVKFNSLLESKLSMAKHNKSRALFYYIALVKTGNFKLLEPVQVVLTNFFIELKEHFFIDFNHLDIFMGELHIFHKFIFAMKDLGDISHKKMQVKMSIRELLDKLADFLEKMVLEEDINENMGSMEDLAFREGRAQKVSFRLKDYTFPSKIFDMLIEMYEGVVDLNVASDELLTRFNVIFTDGFKQLDLPQFSRVLYAMCRTNYDLDNYAFQIEDFLKNKIYDSPEVIVKENENLAIALAFYFCLKQDFNNPIWKEIDRKLQQISLEISSLPLDKREVITLIKSLMIDQKQDWLQTVSTRLDENALFLGPCRLSKYLEEFFFHLFLKNLKTDVPIGYVNVHYVQDNYALVCADYDNLTSNLDVLNGKAQLAKMILDTTFENVGVVMKTKMDSFDKKNEEMHYLRQTIKKWKIDYQAKEDYYNKPFENVLVDNVESL